MINPHTTWWIPKIFCLFWFGYIKTLQHKLKFPFVIVYYWIWIGLSDIFCINCYVAVFIIKFTLIWKNTSVSLGIVCTILCFPPHSICLSIHPLSDLVLYSSMMCSFTPHLLIHIFFRCCHVVLFVFINQYFCIAGILLELWVLPFSALSTFCRWRKPCFLGLQPF